MKGDVTDGWMDVWMLIDVSPSVLLQLLLY